MSVALVQLFSNSHIGFPLSDSQELGVYHMMYAGWSFVLF